MGKIRKGLGLHEPLRHEDHSRPRTRREFVAQSFMTGAATVLAPSLFGLLTPRKARAALAGDISALLAPCGITLGAGLIPFICFDLAGGGNIAGSNVLVGGPGGQLDFLTTAGYNKLGLPGTRTGMVIAPERIAKAISSLTAIVGLANGNIGQQIVLPWMESGKILEIGPKILRPFYEEKGRMAAGWAREFFSGAGVDWAMHVSEGAFFHWFWLKNLRLTTRELYERLKARKVLTVPGEYFFFGLEQDWPHRHECLRVNFSRDAETVREGYRIIAEEAANAAH